MNTRPPIGSNLTPEQKTAVKNKLTAWLKSAWVRIKAWWKH